MKLAYSSFPSFVVLILPLLMVVCLSLIPRGYQSYLAAKSRDQNIIKLYDTGRNNSLTVHIDTPPDPIPVPGSVTFRWSPDPGSPSNLKAFLKGLPQHQFEDQKIIIDKSDDDDSYSMQRQNATFAVLCRNNDTFELLETLQNIQDRFNHQFNYDYTFLNDEPFTPEFIYIVSSFIPKGKLNFGSIPSQHWGFPSHIDPAKVQEIHQDSKYPYASSESYRHMCRFYSGFFHLHPLVSQYQYYWRLEPGVKYYCDISHDLFADMASKKKKYGFVISLFEYSETIPTLWDSVKEYAAQYETSSELIDLVQNDDPYQSYNLCHFWSNFEIADLSIFNDPQYQHFFEYLDRKGGFYYERWGDAPVHTMAIALFLKKEDIHWFNDFGYHHPPYTQCPPEPDVFLANKCTCDPDEDFTYGFLSCTPHFLKVLAS